MRIFESDDRNPEKAVQTIIEHERWMQTEVPIPIDSVRTLLVPLTQDAGILYTLGRDRSHRPVVIINGEKIAKRNVQPEELLRLSYFVLEYVRTRLLVPGKVETWLILLDLANVSLTQMPTSALESVMSALRHHYFCNLRRVFVLNASYFVSSVWWVVQYFLEEVTRRKIVFCGRDVGRELREVIPEWTLERRFGGKVDDLVSGFEPRGDLS